MAMPKRPCPACGRMKIYTMFPKRDAAGRCRTCISREPQTVWPRGEGEIELCPVDSEFSVELGPAIEVPISKARVVVVRRLNDFITVASGTKRPNGSVDSAGCALVPLGRIDEVLAALRRVAGIADPPEVVPKGKPSKKRRCGKGR